MHTHLKTHWRRIAIVAAVPLLALTLAAQQTDSLAISGQSGQAQVVQIQGRSYVDVEGLARILNGSISFNGSQMLLTVPALNGSGSAPDSQASGLSKGFLNAAIEAMSQAREWHSSLKTAIERSYPISEEWIGPLRRQAQQSLAAAKVAASTPTDHEAFPLFNNEFNNMNKLSDKYLLMVKNMNYIAPNSLSNDPLEQRLVACGHSLVNILSSGQFVDDGSCH
jgi:hypothetical protein